MIMRVRSIKSPRERIRVQAQQRALGTSLLLLLSLLFHLSILVCKQRAVESSKISRSSSSRSSISSSNKLGAGKHFTQAHFRAIVVDSV